VTVTRTTGTLTNVTRLAVVVTLESSQQQSQEISVPVSGSIPPDRKFALGFDPKYAGAIVVKVTAEDSSGRTLASGSVATKVAASQSVAVEVELLGAGGGADMAVPPDLSAAGDLAPAAYCGDGTCDPNETCASCATDCCPACAGLPSQPENTPALCSDGCDNDHNGYTDCDDFNCCDQVVCPSGTGCGARQACAACGSGCPAGTTCDTRICDGQSGCYYPNSNCQTIGGTACTAVAIYDRCTSNSDCPNGTKCTAEFVAGMTRCWPTSGAGGIMTCPTSPPIFCPPPPPSATGVGTTCTPVCECAATCSCTYYCELTCTSSSACPYGLQCKGSYCSD
jgi:hypothetical protein